MKFHIVRNGETLSQIAFAYNLEEEELKKENKHIRVWDRLIPGTKLKIPVIPEAVDQDITQMEPFVEDYYPKLNLGTQVHDNEFTHSQFYELDGNTNKEVEPEEQFEVDKETTEIQQTNVNPIVTKNIDETKDVSKKEEEKEEENEDDEEPETNLRTQPVVIPYYPVYYYQYPRYVYPQYVYPVYLYPRRLY